MEPFFLNGVEWVRLVNLKNVQKNCTLTSMFTSYLCTFIIVNAVNQDFTNTIRHSFVSVTIHEIVAFTT